MVIINRDVVDMAMGVINMNMGVVNLVIFRLYTGDICSYPIIR